jgi:phthiocerol/phenolphthiocerol synthesis type-I polyketide synthase B
MSRPKSTSDSHSVAIVGIGCRFPGGVFDAESFWRLLDAGEDAITEIPGDRIGVRHYFDPVAATPGRIMTRWGGFLGCIETFDAGFFGISPREAERLDPQQRLLLETAWEALEDAGQDLHRIEPTRSGVFIGQWTSDFESRLFADPETVDFHMTTGSGRYAASGRLSYCLGFRGPSLTIDTACSSSLVAVHLAVRSIRAGESRLALAGGANIILQPHITVAYSQSRMMAADGRCKFGDASGDGYVRSEGVGIVVLKALQDAVDDGDRIYAVIRGSAINNDGRSSGSMGTPSRSGQEELLRAAYDDAAVSPGQVTYVEAHGTGTRVGDPVELAALGSVLGQGRAPGSPVYVGSVKTNIGHTEGAAGVAGLIKATLALHLGSIPPSMHCRELNPAIPWADIPCEIPRTRLNWPNASLPRLAGISAFGIAGTNGHVVLEQAPVTVAVSVPACRRQLQLLPLSAQNPEALRALALLYAELLSADDTPALYDVCWNAATGRTALDHRAVFVAADRIAMADALRCYASGESAAAEGVVHADASPRIAFVLPGQGAQWIGMARELIDREPAFRAALERCDHAARRFVDWSILGQLAAAPDSKDLLLVRIDVIQPVLVALAIAYAELLRSVGVEPDAVVGHSMGEVAAACIAGALDFDQAMQVVCARSALMRRVSGQGVMALVDLPMAELRGRLAGLEDRVSVAASNGPRSSVISGVPEAVRAVMAGLETEDVFCRLVKVDVASHSPQMEPLAEELATALDGLMPGPVRVPIYSTALGRRAEGKAFDAGYWARNLREPVLFSTAVGLLAGDGVTVFLELGPHPILLPSVQQTVPTATVIASARRDEPEQAAFLTMLGSLWAAGRPIDWRRVMPESGTTVRLPLYPWQRERHWVDAAEIRPAGGAASSACLRPDEEARGWVYRLEWKPSEISAPDTTAANAAARWIVVTGDEAAGAAVAAALAAAGVTSEVVPVRQLEAAFRAPAAGAAYGILVLAEDDQEAAFLPLRVLQSYLASTGASTGPSHPRFWFVTHGAQSVMPDQAERVSVDQAALWGAGRVVAEEHPDLWGGLVDLDPAAPPSLNAGWLARSLLGPDGEDQIALRQGRRYALRLIPAGSDLVSGGLRWREDAAYLVTGGLGGVGLQIARAMAAGGARRLILAGRTALPPRDRWSAEPSDTAAGQRIAAVRNLESMGVAVHTPAVDVSDEDALRSFLDHYVAQGWPPIRGVIHAAVALNNRLAGAMDSGTFASVVRSKLRSAQLLDRLLPDLDLFVLFSSIGAFLCHPGVANYAAANAGLDALAQDRRARGLPAMSIAWGPWENAGLALGEAGEHAIIEMGRLGIRTIPIRQAAALFGWLSGGSAPTVAVMPADWARFQQARSGRPALLFKPLLAGLPAMAVEPSDLHSQLEAAGPVERRRILEPIIRSAVGHVLKIAPSRLDGRKALGNMGLSSLMAIELRNRLETVLGRPLSATLAWNYPTIEAIVGYLAEDEAGVLPAAASPTVTSPAVTPVPPPGGELIDQLSRVASLSDQAVMLALLAQPADGAR